MSFAQSSVFLENFNNGCMANCLASSLPGWSITSTGTNGAFANNWFVSCAENGMPVGSCGAPCGANATLHLASVAGSPGGLCPTGDCGAAYDASLASIVTNRRVESPVIDCSSFTGLSLNYNFIAAGTPGVDFYEILYSSNGGSTWNSMGPGPTSSCCCNFLDCFLSGCCAPATTTCGSLRQGQWTAANLALPASADNNPNVRIAFNWTNNGDNLGTDPSVAIDEFELQGTITLDQVTVDLHGQEVNQENLLQWEVPSAHPFQQIDLVHSANGIHFTELRTVFPTESSQTFQHRHSYSSNSTNFYQLRFHQPNGQIYHGEVLEMRPQAAEHIAWEVSPNPVSSAGSLRLDLQASSPQTMNLEVWDLQGKLVHQEPLTLSQGPQRLQIFLPELSPGLYLLRAKGQTQHLHHKLWVQ